MVKRPEEEDLPGAPDARWLPRYSVSEAARITGLPRATIRVWFWGNGIEPVLRPDKHDRFLSFMNLVEAYGLGALARLLGLRLARVRRAFEYLQQEFGVDRPLLRRRLLYTDGVDVFIRESRGYLNVSRWGQWAIREIVDAYLRRIEFAPDDMPSRLYPVRIRREVNPQDVGNAPRVVVVDPFVSFGRPTIAGTGIPIEEIADRFRAGDSIKQLSEGFGIEPQKIEAALRFAA